MNPILSNLHTHTVFSDGTSTAEEYVLEAVGKGFLSLGFAEHAWTPYDSGCCIKQENIPRYFAEIQRLRERYGGQITLYTGWETDYYQHTSRENVDFLIGSAHYIRDERTGRCYTIDHLPAIFEEALQYAAGGDIRSLVERYYRIVTDIALNQQPDIIGHMDLITKLNRGSRYFDPGSGWYRGLIGQTADALVQSGCIVEINTGGMFRGYTDTPYPAEPTLRELHARGVPVTISSDAHNADGLDYRFAEMAKLLREIGYTATRQLVDGKFADIPLTL